MVVSRAIPVLALFLAFGCDSGSPPDIQGLSDQVATVGHEISIALDGTDPDGDRLTYSVKADIALEGVASITETPGGMGMFRWTPLAGDAGMHTFDFTVSDGKHDTTVSIVIDVREAVGAAPVFIQPLGAGTVFNPAMAPCISVDIVIMDQDTANVDIAQEDPVIDGAMFMQIDGQTASWKWCPTPAQITAQSRYTLELSADDHDNAKTIKDYVIVLQDGGSTTPTVMLNEIDNDQINTDYTEYVEIYNPGGSSAPLAGLALVMVNGNDNNEYARIDLSTVGQLGGGQYLVIAGAMVTVPPSALKLDPTWTHDDIQNGSPDGIAIIDTVTNTIVDTLSYEGAITMANITGFPGPVSLVEGTALDATVADSNTDNNVTLCRNPDGTDTNDNATDWSLCTHVTPGTANQP
jgi:hypothetical protein